MTDLKEKLFQLVKEERKFLFLLLIVLALWLPYNEGSMTNGAIFFVQTVILLIFTLSLMQLSRKGTFKMDISWLEILFLLALAWGVITIAFSPYRYSSLLMWIDFIFLGLLYFSFKISQFGKRSLKVILSAILATALVSTVWAYVQYFIHHLPRAAAGFLDPNYLATLMNIALSFLVAILLFGKISRSYRLLVLGFSLLFLGTLLMTKSRGGFLSLILMLSLAIFIRNKNWLIIPIIVLILIVVVPNPLRNHVINQRLGDIYAFKRLDIWKMCFRMIADKPLLGFTPGNFKLFTPAYNFPVKEAIAHYSKIPRQAHNSLLQWSVEMGAPGIIFMLAGLGVLSACSLKLIRRRKEISPLALGVLFALLAIFIQSLVSNNLYNRAIMLYFGMFIYYLQNQFFSLKLKKPYSAIFREYSFRFHLGNKKTFELLAILVAILAFIIIVFIPFYSEYESNKARSILSKSHLTKEDTAKGSKKLQLAVKLVPYQAYYHQYLADLYRNYFNFSSNLSAFYYAYQFYSKAIEINSVESEFYIGRIKLYSHLLEKGYGSLDVLDNIERDFNSLIELRPKNAFEYFDLAKFYLATNQIEKARNNLIHAVELEPNFIEAHYFLMKIYDTLEDAVEAEKEQNIYYDLTAKFKNYAIGEDLYLKRLLAIPGDDQASR